MDFDEINRRSVEAVFQPIVSMENGDILGYEAFTRIDGECVSGIFKELDDKDKIANFILHDLFRGCINVNSFLIFRKFLVKLLVFFIF